MYGIALRDITEGEMTWCWDISWLFQVAYIVSSIAIPQQCNNTEVSAVYGVYEIKSQDVLDVEMTCAGPGKEKQTSVDGKL